MDFRDRSARDSVIEIAQLLAIGYQRYRSARRIETADDNAPESANRELDIPRPEWLHVREVQA